MHLGKESGNVGNIALQERIENRHVSFFAEEYVVCQILDDFRDEHQTPTQYHVIFLRNFNIDRIRRDHGGRDETLDHWSGKNRI